MAALKKIICPKCKAKLKYNPDKIVSEVVKFKCPGCSSVLRIKKPVDQKETSLPSATSQPADLLKESGIEKPGTLYSGQDSASEIKKDSEEASFTDRSKEVDTSVSEKKDLDFSAAAKSKPEVDGPLIPEDMGAPHTPTEESTREDYDHKNLRGPEKEEAGVSEPQAEPGIKQPVYSGQDSAPEIKKGSEEGSLTDRREEVGTPVSEKKDLDFSAASKSKPESDGPLIPEDKVVPLKPPGESILEDYDHENLQEYEEGDAEEGDLEWTRYADNTGPLIPESKIDLNVIPVSDIGLQDTLADLQQSETYNLQGEHHLEKNRIKQALRDFDHALEINPDYVDALVNRGSAYALQNRYNDALKDFNHALEIDRKQAEVYNLRGEIYLLNKMYEQATKDFTAAIILNPMYSDAFLNRARAYAERGMDEEADSDYNQAVKAAPDKFSDFDDLETSESLFDEESSSTKEKAAQYFQQGLEDLKNEKYYEAIENLTQAINISSNDAGPYIYRGQAYIELGQPDEAMVDLNRAVIYDPLNPALYYWRAMAWKALDSPINLVADLKLSCELGYEPACEEYHNLKPKKH